MINEMQVFIAHQKGDREEAKKIATYLRSINIRVYFDEYDRELKKALRENNPKGVVKAIEKGLKSSTHMICLISKNTLYSKWVPFEIGYGYDKTKVYSLTLKGIKDYEIPDYIKATEILRDILDLNIFAKQYGSKRLFEQKNYSNRSSYLHPLSGIMDPIVS
ncbi:toll/interleukin-1 receptor domain-containing protein [Gracilimonas sediminicola]|uniref:Toll/interleukin-1 receptor domain-containing protein n=1 Tax=Gracilimonas sediminicola TaxID=2952158 RepID=A0A9X2L507_9BACT|nr:toll/interleukin-1 receptor domain-containing protein [Gracilimonas sediminicola]MCP9291813.1 toll/interleukin-1 receptor domain-containing protein [Gracilimonas sediminicola]